MNLNLRSSYIYLFLFCLLYAEKATAQTSIDKEPFHKVVLENEYIRLLDGRIPSLDTTLMHIHAANSVVVFLSKSTFGIQNIEEKPAVVNVNPGDVVYRAYGDRPVNHKVWDQSNSLFHFWVVELVKQHLGKDTCSILSLPHVELQWQKELVRAYKLRVERGEDINLPKSNCAYLVINISGTASVDLEKKRHLLQPNDYLYSASHKELKFTNNSKKITECVLIELK